MKSLASSDNVLGIFGGIPLPILSKACVYMAGEKIASQTVSIHNSDKENHMIQIQGMDLLLVCMHF